MNASNTSPRGIDYSRVLLVLPALIFAFAVPQYLVQVGLADLLSVSGADKSWVLWGWNTTNSWPAQAIRTALVVLAGCLGAASAMWLTRRARQSAKPA